jgi:superfamily I DNA/RNA helicase
MFEKFGSQTDVKKLHMSTNFRSDRSIVNASKALVSMNIRRESKRMEHKDNAAAGTLNIGINFTNECAEYKHIVKEAKAAIENNKSLAVLYRFNTSSLPIITYFYKNNIPYMS